MAVLVAALLLCVTRSSWWRWPPWSSSAAAATGVLFADPRSIAGVATLAQSLALRDLFSSLDVASSAKDVRRQIGQRAVVLGSSWNNNGAMVGSEFGILLLGSAEGQSLGTGGREKGGGAGVEATPGRMPVPRVTLAMAGLVAFLLGLNALVVYYLCTDYDTGFERFMSGQSFGPRLLFTVCGIIVNFAWVNIFEGILRLAPYYSMAFGRSTARTSVSQPYATDAYTALAYGIRGSPLVAAISLPTVLSDFLPLLMANIPFQRTTIWTAHLISSWIAVGIMALMAATLAILAAVLVLARPKGYVNTRLVAEAPVVAILLLLSGSHDLMLQLQGLSTLVTRARDKRVAELGLWYRLGWNWTDARGSRTAIEVVQADLGE
ncbi:hypothetical protein B0H63DRAFT_456635, partial [Podospora didyma]